MTVNFLLSEKKNKFKQGAISHISNDQHGKNWKIIAIGKQDFVELKSGVCCRGGEQAGLHCSRFW